MVARFFAPSFVEPENGREVLLLVQDDALVVHVAIEVDGELRDAQHRTREADEATLDVRSAALGRGPLGRDEDAACEREIAIEPRVEERAAVDLDAELGVALLLVLGRGLEPEVRAVGVRADDAEARDALAVGDDEREDARAAVREGVAARGEARPVVRLGDGAEAGGLEARGGARDGVERGRRVAEEGERDRRGRDRSRSGIVIQLQSRVGAGHRATEACVAVPVAALVTHA